MTISLSSAKKRLAILTVEASLIFFAVLGTPFFSHAAVLYSQTVKDTSFSVSGVTNRFQYLGTGLNGLVQTVIVNMSSTGLPSPLGINFSFICHNSSAHALANPATAECTGIGIEQGSPDLVSGGGQTDITWTLSTPFPFDSAKFYVLYVESSTNNKLMWGSASDLYAAGDCFSTVNTCGAVTDLYFIIDDGFVDTSTHIQTVIPTPDTTVATSSGATFGVTGYVSDTDYESGMYVQVKYAAYSASQASVANPDSLFTVLTFPITSSGGFSVSTTSPLITAGLYTMQTQIRTGSWLNSTLNFLGFGQFANDAIKTATSTRFTAAHLGGFDIFMASTTAAIEAYYASSTISMAACTDWISFALLDCLNLIFVPQAQPIVAQLEAFKNGFLQYAPWGYLTRVVVILSGSSTSTLPSFTATIPLGSPDDLETLTFDMGDMIAGGGALLNSIPARGSALTIQDILRPLIDLFIALFVVIIIVRDLTGVGQRGRHNIGHMRE